VVVLPRLVDRRDFDTLKFYDQSLAAVRYAQKVAIAQRSQVFVVVAPASLPASLSVCFDAGCATPVVDPGSGSALTVVAPGGVTLSMSQPSFAFTGLGSPSGVATPVLVTVSGVPVRSFTVEPETGYVHP